MILLCKRHPTTLKDAMRLLKYVANIVFFVYIIYTFYILFATESGFSFIFSKFASYYWL